MVLGREEGIGKGRGRGIDVIGPIFNGLGPSLPLLGGLLPNGTKSPGKDPTKEDGKKELDEDDTDDDDERDVKDNVGGNAPDGIGIDDADLQGISHALADGLEAWGRDKLVGGIPSPPLGVIAEVEHLIGDLEIGDEPGHEVHVKDLTIVDDPIVGGVLEIRVLVVDIPDEGELGNEGTTRFRRVVTADAGHVVGGVWGRVGIDIDTGKVIVDGLAGGGPGSIGGREDEDTQAIGVEKLEAEGKILTSSIGGGRPEVLGDASGRGMGVGGDVVHATVDDDTFGIDERRATDAFLLGEATNDLLEAKGKESDGETQDKDDGDQSNLFPPGLTHLIGLFPTDVQ